MNTCNPSCVTSIPSIKWADECEVATRPGGIPFLLFYKCDPDAEFAEDTGDLSPWSSLENVRQAICQEQLFVTGELLGQKPKGTSTKRRISSCSPEQVIAGSKTITFQDYNSSPDDLIEFDFWAGVQSNQKYLQIGWVTCDDRLYQSSKPFSLDIDEVADPDSETGLSFMDGEVVINEASLIIPIKVPGLFDLLKNFTTAQCYG